MRSSLLFALAPLAACNLADLADDVKGVTNPLIAEGIMLGVAPPESEDIDLSGTEFSQNAAAGAMLADAKGVDDMADAPVAGAEVAMLSDVIGRVDFGEDSAGTYSADSGDGLDYVEGDEVVLSMTIDGEISKISSRLPPAPNTATRRREATIEAGAEVWVTSIPALPISNRAAITLKGVRRDAALWPAGGVLRSGRDAQSRLGLYVSPRRPRLE